MSPADWMRASRDAHCSKRECEGCHFQVRAQAIVTHKRFVDYIDTPFWTEELVLTQRSYSLRAGGNNDNSMILFRRWNIFALSMHQTATMANIDLSAALGNEVELIDKRGDL